MKLWLEWPYIWRFSFIIKHNMCTTGDIFWSGKRTTLGYSHVYIAFPMQVEEMYAPEINDFVYITDNAYSALEIRQMELRSFNFM